MPQRARGGRQRETEAERQHRRWYCTVGYCGRGGSRHFENLWDSSWGGVFLCIACPAMQAESRPHLIKKFCGAKTKP